MIIGHLPAGYVASRLAFARFESTGIALKWFLVAGILGSVAPDFDMLYFHLIDGRRHHHHTYFTHWPIVWSALLLLSAAWFCAGWQKSRAALAVIFSFNGCLHMALDSIVGDIWWLAPFVDQRFSLFVVPAYYKWAYLNFFLHWSFAFELALVAWAVYLWRRPAPAVR